MTDRTPALPVTDDEDAELSPTLEELHRVAEWLGVTPARLSKIRTGLERDRGKLPADTRVRMFLDPQTDTERETVDHMCKTLSPEGMEALAAMVSTALRQAMHDSGWIARHECLDAVRQLVDEIEGGERAETERERP